VSQGELSFKLLGPIRVWRGDTEVHVGPARPREVLGVLLLRPGRVLLVDEIVSAVWGSRRPATAENLVHKYIGRLRRLLVDHDSYGRSTNLLTSVRPGYRLDVKAQQVDAIAFQRYIAGAREARTAGDIPGALGLFRRAVGLWHGTALQGATGPMSVAQRTGLHELRLEVIEEFAGIRLMVGDDQDLVPELLQMTTEHPLRERLWWLLLVALGRRSRRAEALTAFHDLRMILADRLGVEPGRDLQELYQRLLHSQPVTITPWWNEGAVTISASGPISGRTGLAVSAKTS
jgi:SARP family transcriptional regulator, regulator of embCAB operon